MDNTVTLVGNLTRDPELRIGATGTARMGGGIAVNRRTRNKQTEEWEDETSFFNFIAWGELAEHAAETFTKGHRVVLTGRLQQRSWETDEGEKRSTVEVVADEISPSLRWATANVERTAGKGAGKPAAKAATASVPNEEPF